MRSLSVRNAGFSDVNGAYIEIKENVFEMVTDSGRIYTISIDDESPFAFNVWTIKRVDGMQEIAIYCNVAKELTSCGWKAVVGSEPWPVVEFMSAAMKQDVAAMDTEKRKYWKKGTEILFWSRNSVRWKMGKIAQSTNGFLFVSESQIRGGDEEKETVPEMSSESEGGWFQISSELLQSARDQDEKRKIKKKQNVYVWSRGTLKWKIGTIADIEQDFCFVACGKESRWVQRDSSMLQL